jgi:excisionase family DNA binding protein
MEKLLLTAAEVGEMIGVGKSKTYELLAAGLIPSVRIGKSLRVPADRLRAWIEALEVNERTADGSDRPATPPTEVTPTHRARGSGD